MPDPMEEIRASFFVECEELLESLMDGLAGLSEGTGDAEAINTVFRAVHSIKGGAGAFGLDGLVAFAHIFESALDAMREGRIDADQATIGLFFQAADFLSDLVRCSREGTDFDTVRSEHLRTQLEVKSLASSGVKGDSVGGSDEGFFVTPLCLDFEASAPNPQSYSISFIPEPELFDSGNEPLFLIRALAELGELEVKGVLDEDADFSDLTQTKSLITYHLKLSGNVTREQILEVFECVDGLCTVRVEAVETLTTQPSELLRPTEVMSNANQDTSECAPETAPAPKKPTTSAMPKATVRVDLERIDRLVNLVGELVINQSMLSQSVSMAGLASDTAVSSGLDELFQLTRDIQDSVMMIRAQPVKSLFQRMARIVREASADLNKTVILETIGVATEIDKTVIERLADPLTHIIRNAIDHGIEDAQERIDRGKPPEGRITLSASHRSGRVLIEVADDGGGINRDKVRQIAEAKGLIETAQQLSEGEIDSLLFLPGFSTADEVSSLSGRGVGMDVVKSSINALGGRISLVSSPGVGTTLSVSLPLTLAVLDGMVVRCESETLVLPLGTISETLTLRAADIRPLGSNATVLRVRDSIVPVLDLGVELGYRAPRKEFAGAIGLLIELEDGTQAAIVVDTIEDQRQVVIKGLEGTCSNVPGIAAATILGDGKIALILDPADLISRTAGESRQPPTPVLEGAA